MGIPGNEDASRVWKGVRNMEIHGLSKAVTDSIPPLKDPFGRVLDYLRIAITDRCNLRCQYCMPAEGVQLKPRSEILSFNEILDLASIFVELGVQKVRITGGEPMIRKGVLTFMQALRKQPGLKSIHLTSNGFWSPEQIQQIASLPVESVNVSLDTLDPGRFQEITRRDAFHTVWDVIQRIETSSISLKINSVIQKGLNEDELIPLAELARTHDLDIRFIEQMPFNGELKQNEFISGDEMKASLESYYPQMEEIISSDTTSRMFRIPGFVGKVGIISGYSRSFCGSCSRLRLTPEGQLKTCLYDNGVLDLKNMLRSGASREQIRQAILAVVEKRKVDGFAAEADADLRVKASMATIGG
jgi:cyclic pyranopterin phosphate synthase